jgi:prepilin-type processing-associated H-X9-DG protein
MSDAATPLEPAPDASGEGPAKKKARKGRTIEAVFRVAYREQLELTALADSKANIMIQINGLIISIMLASSSVIVDVRTWLWLPCGALSLTALLSIVFAVLAARPKLRKPPQLTVGDVHSGRANILFFGNFGRLTEDEFVAGMREMFEDSERVYLNMTRHIHGLGHVLLRKFRLLRISYTLFLGGLFVSCALFLVSLVTAVWGAS